MKIIKQTLAAAVMTACLSSLSYAGYFTSDRAGTTAAQFLRLGIGARPVAMGETFAGIADDINSVYWNPAGLNNISSREVSAMHAVWFEDISFSWLAYAQEQFGGTMGVAFNYLTVGKMESYDNQNNRLSGYDAYDFAGVISYAREIKGIPAGVNLKVLNSRIEDETAFGAALDIGAFKVLPVSEGRNITAGISVQNIGPAYKFINEADPLPLNIKMGAATTHFSDALLVGLDINFPVDNTPNMSVGAEYAIDLGKFLIFPRAGFKTATIDDLDALSGLSAGIGFEYNSIAFDYAWVPYWEFGDTHRVSAGYKFGRASYPREPGAVRLTRDERLYQRGLRQLERENYLEAVELFTEALIINPEHPGALESLDEAHKGLQ